jgi:hypothetical protein
MKNCKTFVESILDNSPEPNIKNRVTDMSLIQATARSGNLDVLKILLKKENVYLSLKDHNKPTVFHWLDKIGDWKRANKEKLKNCSKLVLCFDSCSSGVADCRKATKCILDFKLSPYFECRIFAFGLFPGVCSLNANVSEHSVRSIFIGE